MSYEQYKSTPMKIGKFLWRHGMSTLAVKTALAENVEFTNDDMIVSLIDGRKIIVPLVWFPHLTAAARS